MSNDATNGLNRIAPLNRLLLLELLQFNGE